MVERTVTESSPDLKSRILAASNSVWTQPLATRGLAILRVIYGTVGIAYYLVNYADRHYLWGPKGVVPHSAFRDTIPRPNFSLYEFGDHWLYFEVVFHLGILVALAFLVGALSRLTNLLHFVFLTSLYLRNPLLLDGGDNLAVLVLFFLVFTDTSATWSLRKKPRSITRSNRPRLSILVHNLAVFAIIVQLLVLYTVSGLHKVQGALWQDGTALYYILQVPEFSWPPFSDVLRKSAFFSTAGTYFTVFFQLSFAGLMLNRYARYIGLAVAVIFHASVAILMGLTAFGAYIIATEAVLLKDAEYNQLQARARVLVNRILNSIGNWRARAASRGLAE